MADLRVRAAEIIAKLAGGTDGEKAFPHEPDELSRGELLSAIADHIEWLTLPADWRHGPLVRDAD